MSVARAHQNLCIIFVFFINMWSEIYKYYQLFFVFTIIQRVCHDPPRVGQCKSLFPSSGREQMLRFWIPPSYSLRDWCWPCFYIVTISTSTTKCFSPVFLHATNHRKELPNAWMPWTLTFWKKKRRLYVLSCMTLETEYTLLCNKSTS